MKKYLVHISNHIRTKYVYHFFSINWKSDFPMSLSTLRLDLLTASRYGILFLAIILKLKKEKHDEACYILSKGSFLNYVDERG